MSDVESCLAMARKYLPRQGSLEVFVHHNTLHAFEAMNFFDALKEAEIFYGARTYKYLGWYRDRYKKKEISDTALEFSIRKNHPQLFQGSHSLRSDFLDLQNEDGEESYFSFSSGTFWDQVTDLAFANFLKNDLSIKQSKFFSAFFDQGQARWPMEGRECGLLSCFFSYCSAQVGVGYSTELRNLEAIYRNKFLSSSEDGIHCLFDEVGIGAEDRQKNVFEFLYRIKGWAALAFSLETGAHPGNSEMQFDMKHFLAAVLLFQVAAFKYLKKEGKLRELHFFQAKRLGKENTRLPLDPSFHNERSSLNWLHLRIWHEAFEATLLEKVSVVMHANMQRNLKKHASKASPRWQMIFCIDEREESIRRHLEEIDEGIETYGYVGNFGLNIFFKAVEMQKLEKLCPVSESPQHYVFESEARVFRRRRLWMGLRHFFFRHSKSLFGGSIASFLAGPFSILFFFLDVFFPLFSLSHFKKHHPSWNSRLDYEEREPGKPRGFKVLEMADVVEKMLKTIGLKDFFSPLVVICGHGSEGTNNPHIAAYNCGACSGNQGGVNARLLALMANREDVREVLGSRGISIPSGTTFLGGLHNTCSDEFTFYDHSRIKDDTFDALKHVLRRASERNSQERLRKFEDENLNLSREGAWRRAMIRARDFSQTRAEYGHNTNALCFIGRRSLTRGLFLDRRAFLVSYDGVSDAEGVLLGSLLAVVLPVCSGINLEYYFSFVNQEDFGAGVKQGHNVTSLSGVMNGYKGDLQLGLPWQMVEIHEPVRLTVMVEADREKTLNAISALNESTRNLIENEWVRLVSVESDGELHLYREGGFSLIQGGSAPLKKRKSSFEFYGKKRGLVDFGLVG